VSRSEFFPFDPGLTLIWATTMIALNTAREIEHINLAIQRSTLEYEYQKQKGDFLIELHRRLP